jgi:hypothetical protein
MSTRGLSEVIICAAAKIGDYGATPSGSHVTAEAQRQGKDGEPRHQEQISIRPCELAAIVCEVPDDA